MESLLTTRQIQELIRVDRITVYRMLKDGRLRGFKVGGQWRFPRREIEAWLQEKQAGLDFLRTPILPGNSPASLSDALPMSCTGAIQGLCAETLDVAAVTTDLDGTPLWEVSNPCGFCTFIRSTNAGRERCASSWRQQPDGEIHLCHAGLLCASAAVVSDGEPVALAVACQFAAAAPQPAEAPWRGRLAELAADLGLLDTDLQASLGSVHLVPENIMARVPVAVRRAAIVLAEIGQERLNLLGRLSRIAEMSKL